MAEGDSKGNLEDDSEDDLHSELRGELSTKPSQNTKSNLGFINLWSNSIRKIELNYEHRPVRLVGSRAMKCIKFFTTAHITGYHSISYHRCTHVFYIKQMYLVSCAKYQCAFVCMLW